MALVPEEVKCAVCRSIFCCMDCRNRHEQNSHNPNDVWTERNRLQCGLCRGAAVMEFCNRNDFALIMHLSETHLPLQCKKCLTQFKEIGDFSAANKCAHLNDVCSLQSPKHTCQLNGHSENSPSITDGKDVSDSNFVTAVQKSSFDASISDSVLSLRNYSTILHASNHPLYNSKTQSPCQRREEREDAMGKALVRQTSTPMHQNLVAAIEKRPLQQQQPQTLLHTNESSPCCACLAASTSSGQISSINSSSDSDTSINTVAKPNDIRQNITQQQYNMMTKMKTAAANVSAVIKRSRKSPTVTPLTRQVMTKSIHRAILEYQHTQNLGVPSPKSPLDLRVRASIYRGRNVTPNNVKCLMNIEQRFDKSPSSPSASSKKSTTTTMRTVTTTITNTHELSAKVLNTLETVYEQEKDENAETQEHIAPNSLVRYCGKRDACDSVAETPIMVLRKNCIDTTGDGSENCDSDIWYTPKEYIQTNVIENVQIFTPKVSKKRFTAPRRVDDEADKQFDISNASIERQNSSASTQLYGSKIWSIVSSFLSFASSKSSSNLSLQEMKTNDNESTSPSKVVIRRCASFAGVLREKNMLASSDDEGTGVDPLQPIKRRRITSIDAKSVDRMATKYQKRIMCRPPIRRMLDS